MTLISKLKSLLGFDARRSDRGGTTVTVEREPRAEAERAVKGSPRPSTATDEAVEPDADEASTEGPVEPDVELSVHRDDSVQSLSGIGPAYAEQLAEAGVETVGDLAAADASELAGSTGLGEGRLSGWIEQAKGA